MQELPIKPILPSSLQSPSPSPDLPGRLTWPAAVDVVSAGRPGAGPLPAGLVHTPADAQHRVALDGGVLAVLVPAVRDVGPAQGDTRGARPLFKHGLLVLTG